jgi:hypothetical protein
MGNQKGFAGHSEGECDYYDQLTRFETFPDLSPVSRRRLEYHKFGGRHQKNLS